MIIRLLAAGTRVPDWVNSGYQEYARRLPRECQLELTEIPVMRRPKGSSAAAIVRKEGEKTIRSIATGSLVVALDAGGSQWSTEELARRLDRWMQDQSSVTLMIGGPDGLSSDCLGRADLVWSLSLLTFPHLLVRVVVAEQIYRAWTLIKGHPYHCGHSER